MRLPLPTIWQIAPTSRYRVRKTLRDTGCHHKMISEQWTANSPVVSNRSWKHYGQCSRNTRCMGLFLIILTEWSMLQAISWNPEHHRGINESRWQDYSHLACEDQDYCRVQCFQDYDGWSVEDSQVDIHGIFEVPVYSSMAHSYTYTYST